MLAFLAWNISKPVEESSDRDPGALTLAISVVRGLRRLGRDAFARRVKRARETGVPGER